MGLGAAADWASALPPLLGNPLSEIAALKFNADRVILGVARGWGQWRPSPAN